LIAIELIFFRNPELQEEMMMDKPPKVPKMQDFKRYGGVEEESDSSDVSLTPSEGENKSDIEEDKEDSVTSISDESSDKIEKIHKK